MLNVIYWYESNLLVLNSFIGVKRHLLVLKSFIGVIYLDVVQLALFVC